MVDSRLAYSPVQSRLWWGLLPYPSARPGKRMGGLMARYTPTPSGYSPPVFHDTPNWVLFFKKRCAESCGCIESEGWSSKEATSLFIRKTPRRPRFPYCRSGAALLDRTASQRRQSSPLCFLTRNHLPHCLHCRTASRSCRWLFRCPLTSFMAPFIVAPVMR